MKLKKIKQFWMGNTLKGSGMELKDLLKVENGGMLNFLENYTQYFTS